MRNIVSDNIHNVKKAYKKVFQDCIYKALAISFWINFLALDYIILSQSTTFRVMVNQNTAFYNWTSITLSFITAILFAFSLTMILYAYKKKKRWINSSTAGSLFWSIFSAVASGCPVCGAYLLPLLGIAGSLAIFPFQWLEIRILAILLLIFSIIQSSRSILGLCKKKNIKKELWITILIVFTATLILFTLPNIPNTLKFKFQLTGTPIINTEKTSQNISNTQSIENIYNQVNPKKGFNLNIKYGNIGYTLVQDWVIDFDKFKDIYARSGNPLTKEQLKIFTQEGLNKNITINRENSYFLLNLFWAFGLANENPILTEGEISKYGKGKVGRFASTGGWTIATKTLEDFMAKSKLAPLTAEQQKLLQKVAENVYRPCCWNSTAFPDCNHGMALLGVLELMASNWASENEMYEAAKYFSAFWFPNQMIDVATYFQITENKDFKDIDAKITVSKRFFSWRGWSGLKGWLQKNSNTGQQQAPQSGGGCGVESGAPAWVLPQQKSQQIAPQGGGGCGV